MSPSRPAAAGAPRRLPRWALALGCVVLTAAFVLALFPYDRIAGGLAAQLRRATGAAVQLRALEPGLSWAGPALVARDLELVWPDGAALRFDQAWVRPAWSLSWLSARPALHLSLRSAAGQLDGTVWPEGPAFVGRVDRLDPGALPKAWTGGEPFPVLGLIDADIDLAPAARGPTGTLAFTSRDGALQLPDVPIAIPYATLEGELERAEDGATTLHRFRLDGPMATLEGSGTLGAAARLGQGALALEVTLERVDPALVAMLVQLGVRLPAGGRTELQISGTPDRPVVRRR